jgi:nucleotide-binding universal stress UspA family protein
MSVKILVPLDGSLFSEQALPVAHEIARRSGAHLHLVKVHVPPIDAPLGDTTFIPAAQLDEEVKENDREYLARVAEAALWQTDMLPSVALLSGPVLAALQKYTHDCAIGLVVMTTHGRSGLSRAWLGSVADALVRSSNIPVLLLRPKGGEAVRQSVEFKLDHILIPVDGSSLSHAVIRPAVALGAITGARFTLLRAVAPPPSMLITDSASPPLPNALVDEMKRIAHRQLEALAEVLRAEGHDVNTVVVVQSHVAAGIIGVAQAMNADLIAMTTHGRGGFTRFALSSVADKVNCGSSVPLLLWRPIGQSEEYPLAELAAAH